MPHEDANVNPAITPILLLGRIVEVQKLQVHAEDLRQNPSRQLGLVVVASVERIVVKRHAVNLADKEQ